MEDDGRNRAAYEDMAEEAAERAARLEEAVGAARERLRVMMLDQPTTGRRETYSDGFAMGLSQAIQEIDSALSTPQPV